MVAHLSLRHQTVAVDLPRHVIQVIALSPAVLAGHSIGCRVVIEAATQAPGRTAGVVHDRMKANVGLRETFGTPHSFEVLIRLWFEDAIDRRKAADDITL
jgi:pimeloyl-ACP methyl ester carboxylesterase